MYVDLVRVQKERKEKISPEIAVSGGAPCSPSLFKDMLNVLGLKKVKVSNTPQLIIVNKAGDTTML